MKHRIKVERGQFPKELENENRLGAWGSHCGEKDGEPCSGFKGGEESWPHFHESLERLGLQVSFVKTTGHAQLCFFVPVCFESSVEPTADE